MKKTCLFLALLMVLALVPAMSAQASPGDETKIRYYDPILNNYHIRTNIEDGTQQFIVVNNSTKSALGTEGQSNHLTNNAWYFFEGVTFNGTLMVPANATVNIVVADGTQSEINGFKAGIHVPPTGTLNIYGGADATADESVSVDQTGRLTIRANTTVPASSAAAIGGNGSGNPMCGNVNFNGAYLILQGTGYSAAVGGWGSSAAGSQAGSISGTVTLNYGMLVAAGGPGGGAAIGGGVGTTAGGNGGKINLIKGEFLGISHGVSAVLGSGGTQALTGNAGTKPTITIHSDAKVELVRRGNGATIGTGAVGTADLSEAISGVEMLTTKWAHEPNKAVADRSASVAVVKDSALTLAGTPTYQWQRWLLDENDGEMKWQNLGGKRATNDPYRLYSVDSDEIGDYRCLLNGGTFESGISYGNYGDDVTPEYGLPTDKSTLAAKYPDIGTIGADYSDNELTGFVPYARYHVTGRYIDDVDVQADRNGRIEIGDDWSGRAVTFVRYDQNGKIDDSNPHSFTLVTSPKAPTGLTSTNETKWGARDGKIIGTTTLMEWRSVNDNRWTTCTGTEITGLQAGDYEIRVKATNSAPAGATAPVTVYRNALVLNEIDFGSKEYGYSTTYPVPFLAQVIARNVTGSRSNPYIISNLSFSVVGNGFSVQGGEAVLAAGATTDTWFAGPLKGLAVGNHTATLRATYTTRRDGKTLQETATAPLYFNVYKPGASPTGTPTKSSPVASAGNVEITNGGALRGWMNISGLSGTELPVNVQFRTGTGRQTRTLATFEDVTARMNSNNKLEFMLAANDIKGFTGTIDVYVSSIGNRHNNGFDYFKLGNYGGNVVYNTWFVKNPVNVVSGINQTISSLVTFNNDGGTDPELTVTSSNSSVLFTDGSIFFGTYRTNPTKATLTFTGADGNVETSTITVLPNVFGATQPRFGTSKKVYSSTRSLAYASDNSGNLNGQIFLINRSSRSATLSNLYVSLYKFNGTNWQRIASKQVSGTLSLSGGRTTVYPSSSAYFTFTRDELLARGIDPVMDLTKDVQMVLEGRNVEAALPPVAT